MGGLALRGPQFTHVVKGVGRKRCLWVLGILRIALGSVPALSDTGTRVLPGGAQEGTEEIAEGFPGQEVRLLEGQERCYLGNPPFGSILK